MRGGHAKPTHTLFFLYVLCCSEAWESARRRRHAHTPTLSKNRTNQPTRKGKKRRRRRSKNNNNKHKQQQSDKQPLQRTLAQSKAIRRFLHSRQKYTKSRSRSRKQKKQENATPLQYLLCARTQQRKRVQKPARIPKGPSLVHAPSWITPPPSRLHAFPPHPSVPLRTQEFRAITPRTPPFPPILLLRHTSSFSYTPPRTEYLVLHSFSPHPSSFPRLMVLPLPILVSSSASTGVRERKKYINNKKQTNKKHTHTHTHTHRISTEKKTGKERKKNKQTHKKQQQKKRTQRGKKQKRKNNNNTKASNSNAHTHTPTHHPASSHG